MQDSKKPIQIYDVKQGSPEWFQLRVAVPTASQAKRMNGEKSLKTYALEIASQNISKGYDEAGESRYSSDYMERGSLLENEAFEFVQYAISPNEMLKKVGFIKNHAIQAGCSPDAVCMRDGYIKDGYEIKIPSLKNFIKVTIEDNPLPGAMEQAIFSLMVTDADKWTIVYYNPSYGVKTFDVTRTRDEIILMSQRLQDLQSLAKKFTRDFTRIHREGKDNGTK